VNHGKSQIQSLASFFENYAINVQQIATMSAFKTGALKYLFTSLLFAFGAWLNIEFRSFIGEKIFLFFCPYVFSRVFNRWFWSWPAFYFKN